MIRAIASAGDIPQPNQPSKVGEFFITPLGYICALCYQVARVVLDTRRCGILCQNPNCAQRGYLYEFERAWLPPAKFKPPEPED
jgi:hypothetical protein